MAGNEYKREICHGLKKGKQKEYFVKKRLPESVLHTYYVDLIYREIKKHTSNVTVYRTERPDIVFVNKMGEEIAIEVETGLEVTKKSKKAYYDEKFAKRKEQYGDRCYIFLVTTRLQYSYFRHQLPIIFRLQVLKFIQSQFSGIHNSCIAQNLDRINRK